VAMAGILMAGRILTRNFKKRSPVKSRN
jgi:hypothetical protein